MAGRRTILMVEDEESITVPACRSPRSRGLRHRVAGTVAEALASAEQRMPDLVLLDVMLPDGSGYDVARTLRERSKVPIIMLTAAGRRPTASSASSSAPTTTSSSPSARASWPRASGRCCAARATRGAAPAKAEALEVGPLKVDRDRRAATLNGQEIDLTRKEFELLALLVSEAGAVISRERLIDEVWDTNWFGSTKTLDVRVEPASQARRRLAEPALHPHRPRRGLPLRRRRRAMSLRARLVVAFTYVLVLVIVALAVPLALNCPERGRRGEERRPQPGAAGRGRRLRPPGRPRPAPATRRALRPEPRRPRARGRQPRAVAADSASRSSRGTDTGAAPRYAARSRAARRRVSATATCSTRTSSSRPSPWRSPAARPARAGDPERRRRAQRAAQ